MTMPCYKSSKSMITAACYKDGESMMTSLIIMKIKFGWLCFRSHARSHDYKSRDHGVTIILSIQVFEQMS